MPEFSFRSHNSNLSNINKLHQSFSMLDRSTITASLKYFKTFHVLILFNFNNFFNSLLNNDYFFLKKIINKKKILINFSSWNILKSFSYYNFSQKLMNAALIASTDSMAGSFLCSLIF